MFSHERDLEKLVPHLHRAAFSRAGWVDFITALEAHLGDARASIHSAGAPGNPQMLSVIGSYESPFVDSYVAHYHRLIPFLQLSAVMPCRQARDARIDIQDDDLRRTEYYNDWMRPQSIARTIALKAGEWQNRTLNLSLDLSARTGDEGIARTVSLLDSLEPHITHAFHVSEALSFSPYGLGKTGGMMVIGSGFKLLWADDVALSLEPRVFRRSPTDRLQFTETLIQDWFIQIISRRPNQGHESPDYKIHGFNYTIQAIPVDDNRMPSLSLGTVANQKAQFILIVSSERSSAATIQKGFGLTDAETFIALEIAKGKTTAEIAASRHASIHTVRNQVRAVLHKLCARHRVDVARILLEATGTVGMLKQADEPKVSKN